MCRGHNAFRVVPYEAPEAALSGPLIKVCQLLLCQEAEHEGFGGGGGGGNVNIKEASLHKRGMISGGQKGWGGGGWLR